MRAAGAGELRLGRAAVAFTATEITDPAAKVPVLRAVLQAGFVSHLVTDERTARAVLG